MSVLYEPVYSKRWLSRPFVLTKTSFRWGLYAITDPAFNECSDEEWNTVATALREVQAERIAIGFEHLLLQFSPWLHKNYLSEISALYTYELSKKNLAARVHVEREPGEVTTARENVAARLRDALLAVFNSANWLHGLGEADEVRYHQMLHDMYEVEILIQSQTCYAVFTSDLVLESIAGNDDLSWRLPFSCS